MSKVDFNNLSYDAFKKLAKDTALDQHERVGFPSWYREHKTDSILADILSKLSQLKSKQIRFLEIGPGWSELTKRILDLCAENEHEIVLIDSQEMLDLIPPYPKLTKIAGKFPEEISDLSKLGKFDVILTYSVLQYPFMDSSIFSFIDTAVSLLAPEGQFLVGDIPNISMKKRFLASPTAKAYHAQNYQDKSETFPEPEFNRIDSDQIDDGVLLGILTRLRIGGIHAFLLPQSAPLPFANRREDLLVIKP